MLPVALRVRRAPLVLMLAAIVCGGTVLAVNADEEAVTLAPPSDMVLVPGGTVTMGSDAGLPDEQPRHDVQVVAFLLDRTPVTVASFAKFVEATGYVTTAEKYGNSAVLSYETGEWALVDRATWRKPLGLDGPDAQPDHPVTQVSWDDANAYCAYYDKRLPTEAEWEHAARNARNDNAAYAFGNSLVADGKYRANIWTGDFPVENTGADGYLYTSPVGAFGMTDLGLVDMAGNVWEWCADWYLPYGVDASGFVPNSESERVQRGGSFLCDPNVCHGFRVSGRSHSTPDSSLMHVGFRCAKNAAP